MTKIIVETKARELINFPKNFDFEVIDQAYGFGAKIFPHITKEQFEALETSYPEIYDSVAKAGLYYSFVLDIPKIKVHLSNYGINQYEQGKTRNAPWWDVRDLGISWLKKADYYLGEALIKLAAVGGEQTAFSENSFLLVSFSDFQKLGFGNSPEVYLKLSELMKTIFAELLEPLGHCTPNELLENEKLKNLIRKYVFSKAIAQGSELGSLVYTTGGIVIQYEELPWQKSVVLDANARTLLANSYLRDSETTLHSIFDYLNRNRDLFPCYEPKQEKKLNIITKKSGVWL